MGKRIKILDLAKDMIRLSGLDENEIEIKFTGLRKGEKMIEELFIQSENVRNTLHEKIYSATADYSRLDNCMLNINKLIGFAQEGEETKARELLFEIAHCVRGKN